MPARKDGAPHGLAGRTHGPDCPHCKAIKSRAQVVHWVPGLPVPVCDCHGIPMAWDAMARLRAGGIWKCKSMASISGRRGRLKKFGLTGDEYDRMVHAQGGVCKICKRPPGTKWNRLAVDHCHTTGHVRSLLCMTCNTTLGRLETKWEAIMDYLKGGIH